MKLPKIRGVDWGKFPEAANDVIEKEKEFRALNKSLHRKSQPERTKIKKEMREIKKKIVEHRKYCPHLYI